MTSTLLTGRPLKKCEEKEKVKKKKERLSYRKVMETGWCQPFAFRREKSK